MKVLHDVVFCCCCCCCLFLVFFFFSFLVLVMFSCVKNVCSPQIPFLLRNVLELRWILSIPSHVLPLHKNLNALLDVRRS